MSKKEKRRWLTSELRKERLQNSVDKWVDGKDVASDNIYTLREYKNVILTRLRRRVEYQKKKIQKATAGM